MTGPIENHREPRRRPGFRTLDRSVTRLTDIMAFLGMTALIGAIAVVAVDIVWRRVGGQSFIGAVDLTRFCVVAAASWAIPHAFGNGNHVVVDLIDNRRFPGFFRIVDALTWLISATVMAFLLYLSWGRAMEQWRHGDVSQDLAIPMILFWGFFLSGMAASVLVCLVKFLMSATTGHRSR